MNRLMGCRRIGVAAIIWAGILSLALVSGCTKVPKDPHAQVEALEITPDNFEQCRRQLVAWANDGNIYAASKMCDMGLWWSMHEVDPDNLKMWSDSSLKIGRRTARQVYAVLLMEYSNGTMPKVECMPFAQEVERILSLDPVEDYVVLITRMSNRGQLDSRYDYSEEAKVLKVLLEVQKPDAPTTLELAHWMLSKAYVFLYWEAENSPRAAEFAAESCRLYEQFGCKGSVADSLFPLALGTQPDMNPKGDWDQAVALYERRADLLSDLGCTNMLAASLRYQAVCYEPDMNPDGSWERAKELYRESDRLYVELGDEAMRGFPLMSLGDCMIADSNPDGDWDEALRYFVQAEKAFSLAEGFKYYAGICKFRQANCIIPDNNPDGNWLEAAELFAEAVKIFQEIGDEENEQYCKDWAKVCVQRAFGL